MKKVVERAEKGMKMAMLELAFPFIGQSLGTILSRVVLLPRSPQRFLAGVSGIATKVRPN